MAIKILKHQAKFIQSNARHTGLVGGFRSGKSHSGVLKTIVKKLELPNVDVAYYLPTYPLIKDIAFPKFTEVLTDQNIPFTLNKSDKDIITPYGRIIMRSMDNPDLIIGYEVGYSLVDEADVLSTSKMQEVMIKILSRNSVKTAGNNNATDFVSTPEGFKFLYNFFVENKSEDKILIKAKTKNNPFISESYIKSLEDEYTPEQLAAYLEGNFVNLTSGTVYSYFDREKNNTDRVANEEDILYLGVDFNIGKMAAVFHVIEKGNDYAVDEIAEEYDTNSLCMKIKQKYPNNKIVVNPDASGKNKKTNASETDIDIIKNYGFLVNALNSNPAVKDRYNVVNKRFQEKKSFVNIYKCPELVKCLERQPFKNGEPDKTLGYDHLTDAKGYFTYYNFKRKKRLVV